MANTIDDITVSKDVYVDVNTLAGIVAGTALVITNKSTSRIMLQISIAQPSAESTAGEILYTGATSTATKIVTAGESTIWAKSLDDVDSPLSVQDNT